MKKLALIAFSMMLTYSAMAGQTLKLITYNHVDTAALENSQLCEIQEGRHNPFVGTTRFRLLCDGVTAIDLTAHEHSNFAGSVAAKNKLKSVLLKHGYTPKDKGNLERTEYIRE